MPENSITFERIKAKEAKNLDRKNNPNSKSYGNFESAKLPNIVTKSITKKE